jgi:cytochrome c5
MDTLAIWSGRMARHGFATILSALILSTATLPLYAQGAAATPPLPDGPGKSLVSVQCTNCHALDVALSKRGTTEEWRGILKTMVERGATITDADTAVIAGYLGQNFGPNAPPPAPAARPAQASALPDFPGRDVLTRRCMQCHQMSMWTALHQDRKAWESTIYRMVGRGALWTEDDIRAMAEYLARIRGPQ